MLMVAYGCCKQAGMCLRNDACLNVTHAMAPHRFGHANDGADAGHCGCGADDDGRRGILRHQRHHADEHLQAGDGVIAVASRRSTIGIQLHLQ